MKNKIKLADLKNQNEHDEKVQTYFLQRRVKEEIASNVEKQGILQESAKMAAKQDTTAEHGEAQHVDETEAEEATTPEVEETSVNNNKESGLHTSRATQVLAHGWQQCTRHTTVRQTGYVIMR